MTFDDKDTPSHSSVDVQYATLRNLAVQDPRGARQYFYGLLDNGQHQLSALLHKISSPGDGRIRQLVANAMRTRHDKNKVVLFLQRWSALETDEFAKRAINEALVGVKIDSQILSDSKISIDRRMIEMHRQIVTRINHRLRNELLGPLTHIIRLQNRIDGLQDVLLKDDLSAIARQLEDAFDKVAQSVELNVGAEAFKVRPIALFSWLIAMNSDYGKKYQPVDLIIDGSPAVQHTRILANDYWLTLVFWNLWTNAQQAVGTPCEITICGSFNEDQLRVIVYDNGHGFPKEMLDTAFQEQYSKSKIHSGIGLLEVADAVDQLHGSIGLIEMNPDEYRIEILFPRNIQ